MLDFSALLSDLAEINLISHHYFLRNPKRAALSALIIKIVIFSSDPAFHAMNLGAKNLRFG